LKIGVSTADLPVVEDQIRIGPSTDDQERLVEGLDREFHGVTLAHAKSERPRRATGRQEMFQRWVVHGQTVPDGFKRE
jgi:hypothetical protein